MMAAWSGRRCETEVCAGGTDLGPELARWASSPFPRSLSLWICGKRPSLVTWDNARQPAALA